MPALRLTFRQWLVLVIASIGFLFDTYELLMTPLVGVPAIAELLNVPPNNPLVTLWMGRMLWLTALCGGTFGLAGGWLIDRFGRKRIMAASIFLYAFSPFAAAFSTSLGWFVFFRCATFVGVCVEFVAAITWLAELFPDKRTRSIDLGATQAYASLCGILITAVNVWIVQHAATLPALPLPELFNAHATWRYALMTGLLPALPIALLLPFVPESAVWREKRAAGTLQPLVAEARDLNVQLEPVRQSFEAAAAATPGLRELAAKRSRNRLAFRAATKAGDKPKADALNAAFKTLGAELDTLTAAGTPREQPMAGTPPLPPPAKAALLEREKILRALGDNRDKQEPLDRLVKERGNRSQLFQETGGLTGRILLALLIVAAIARPTLLRLFLVPGLLVLPVTYFALYHTGGAAFDIGIFLSGLLIVAQFSYFGEYLPKVFPLHLRGTGGSFATNVGGRMLGTSAALLTTNLIAPMMTGANTFDKVARAAGWVALAVFLLGVILSFLLPDPRPEDPVAPAGA